MKRITINYCSVLLSITVMSVTSRAADLIRWAPDLATARQAAVAENKLLLIHFWAHNCAPCSNVEEHVFPRPSVAQSIHENFVPVKVNVDEHPELRLQFQVDRWPTDVMVTPGGQIVHKMVTLQDPRQYVHQLSAIAMTNSPRSSAESHWASSSAQADTQYVSSARPPGVPWQPSDTMRSGEDVPSFSEYGPKNLGQNELMSDQVARDSRFASRYDNFSTNPMGSHDDKRSAIPPPEVQPRSITNRYVEYEPVQRAQHGPVNPRSSESGVNNPSLGQQPSVAAGAGRFAQQPPDVYTNVRMASGQAPLGLDGRCPVTLARDRVWQKGDLRWGAVHRGRTYLFVGHEEQQEFLVEPDKFSPVLAGMDVVRLADEGRVVEGDRRYGVVYDDDGRGPQPSRIYLFDSPDSRNRFEQGPDRFLRPVLQAMQQGKLDLLLR